MLLIPQKLTIGFGSNQLWVNSMLMPGITWHKKTGCIADIAALSLLREPKMVPRYKGLEKPKEEVRRDKLHHKI